MWPDSSWAEYPSEWEPAANIRYPPGGLSYGLGDRHYFGHTRWAECPMGCIHTANGRIHTGRSALWAG